MTHAEVFGDERAVWWERAVTGLAGLCRISGQDRPADPGVQC